MPHRTPAFCYASAPPSQPHIVVFHWRIKLNISIYETSNVFFTSSAVCGPLVSRIQGCPSGQHSGGEINVGPKAVVHHPVRRTAVIKGSGLFPAPGNTHFDPLLPDLHLALWFQTKSFVLVLTLHRDAQWVQSPHFEEGCSSVAFFRGFILKTSRTIIFIIRSEKIESGYVDLSRSPCSASW